jgi:hypothetical protein
VLTGFAEPRRWAPPRLTSAGCRRRAGPPQ